MYTICATEDTASLLWTSFIVANDIFSAAQVGDHCFVTLTQPVEAHTALTNLSPAELEDAGS